MNNPKLTVELVPKSCHYSNVRTMVTPKQWDTIRFSVYDKANHKCEICGDNGLNQGYKHRVECHEVWDYNEITGVQKLINLVSLCPTCHQVKHIGRARMIGKISECYKQLKKINHWTTEMIEKHISDSQLEYRIRSKMQWKLDISLLNKKPYDLNLNLDKERVFNKYVKPSISKSDLLIKEALDRQTKLKLEFDEKNTKTKVTKKKEVKKTPKKTKSIPKPNVRVIFKDSLKINKKIDKKKKKKTNRKPPKKS
jgi:hypothetical protein